MFRMQIDQDLNEEEEKALHKILRRIRKRTGKVKYTIENAGKARRAREEYINPTDWVREVRKNGN